MIQWDFIYKVLGDFEGHAIRKGYIPCVRGTWYPNGPDKGDIMGMSGVTIGTGIDLGQQTERSFDGVNSEIVAKIKPYLTLKREDAKRALQSQPLDLSYEEVDELDNVFKQKYIKERVIPRFGMKAFDFAPKEVQAVASSLIYQFGAPYRETSPALEIAWGMMKNSDYKGAADELENMDHWSAANPNHRQYIRRRQQEAKLLRQIP